MVYISREDLAVVQLPERRDTLSWEEAAAVLEKCPSNTIYVEVEGQLYGIVTMKRLQRFGRDGRKSVEINTHFTSLCQGENLRARKIFREEKVFTLPVLDGGRLLGSYISMSLAGPQEIAVTDRAALPEGMESLVWVRPGTGRKRFEQVFLQWRAWLEESGISPRVIEYEEISQEIGQTRYFLLTTDDERRAVFTLHRSVLQEPVEEAQFITCENLADMCRWNISQITALFHTLQGQGVEVFTFGFPRESRYLTHLNKKIRERFAQHGEERKNELRPWMRPAFFDERYCAALARFDFHIPQFVLREDGTRILPDIDTEFIHVRRGERRTAGQPGTYERTIYAFGFCPVFGTFVEDECTITSYLQDAVNRGGFSCRVVNRGTPRLSGTNQGDFAQLMEVPLKQGDIVLFDTTTWEEYVLPRIPMIDLEAAAERNQIPVDWVADTARHCNHKANRIYAEEIYNKMLPALSRPITSREPVQMSRDYLGFTYLQKYFQNFRWWDYRTIGAIVMNGNPFTLGHRYLIETAKKQVEFLIIFVVEEDRSFFSFRDRFAMARSGTADITNVMVVPSGEFILSQLTFPEYFEKETDEQLAANVENDITLFAQRIAPRLGITHRFVGEEPEDPVTNTYNDAMKRILPVYGIQLVEIPRKVIEFGDIGYISASYTRKCLKNGDIKTLEKLVPASTKAILLGDK